MRQVQTALDVLQAWCRNCMCKIQHAILYDDKCSAETTTEWFSWMFFHWLRTGRWESGWGEPIVLTRAQMADPIFHCYGFRPWLWHMFSHRNAADDQCVYCWDRCPSIGLSPTRRRGR
jgi:hypothetical protein